MSDDFSDDFELELDFELEIIPATILEIKVNPLVSASSTAPFTYVKSMRLCVHIQQAALLTDSTLTTV